MTFGRGPAVDPAAGPGHHPGRRGPRRRDRRARPQGLADRPPGAHHAAHELRGRRPHPAGRHGRRAVPGGVVADRGDRPAAGPQALRVRAPSRTSRTRSRWPLLGPRPRTTWPARTPMRGTGCPECGGTGYRGRTAVYEVLDVDAAMRQVLLKDPTESAVAAQARAAGMLTLRAAAIEKARRGETTFEEAPARHPLRPRERRVLPRVRAARGPATWSSAPGAPPPSTGATAARAPRSLDPDWRICPWCRTPAPPTGAASGTAGSHRGGRVGRGRPRVGAGRHGVGRPAGGRRAGSGGAVTLVAGAGRAGGPRVRRRPGLPGRLRPPGRDLLWTHVCVHGIAGRPRRRPRGPDDGERPRDPPPDHRARHGEGRRGRTAASSGSTCT